MRYNKQELIALASQTSHNFDREGVLILKERQDGFFRRSEGCSVRWFRLRGNLLFYLKGPEPWYEPMGVIVLGNHQVSVQTQDENGHWPFQIVWENGVCYRMATFHESERILWLKAMENAPYENMNTTIADLQKRLNETRPIIDISKFRAQNLIINDINEVPICEMALSCDNLLCDSQGNPPSPFLAVFVSYPNGLSVRYANTEVVENCSNPSFCRTIQFRASDLITGESVVRISVYDIKESVTQTGVAICSTSVKLSTIQEAQRLRIPLLAYEDKTAGFVTLNGWSLEPAHAGSPTQTKNEGNSIEVTPKVQSHRRSQSLPSRLGLKLKYPSYGDLIRFNFLNPYQVTYRFQSGLGGDITVHEVLAEPRFCYTIPTQILEIFITREKELVETMLMMRDIPSVLQSRQVELVNIHLSMIRLYGASQKSMLEFTGCYKPSCRKEELELGFAPVNLHLQRMWVHNDTLNKTGFHDVVTAGAFTAHTHYTEKYGGLIKLVQQFKNGTTAEAEMMANTNRLNAEFEKILSAKLSRDAAVDNMNKTLLAIKANKYNEAANITEVLVTNVKKMLALWDAPAAAEATTKIGWSSKVSGEMPLRYADIIRFAAGLTICEPINRPAEAVSAENSASNAAIPDSTSGSVPESSAGVTHGSNESNTCTDTGTMDYAGALPTSAEPVATSSSSSVDTTPTTDLATALSASVPDMQKKETELQFHSDHFKNEREDQSDKTDQKQIGNRKNGRRERNNRNVNHSFRSVRGPKPKQNAGPAFERHGSLKNDFKSSASLEQVSYKSLVKSKKQEKKKNKKVLRESQLPPRIEINPIVELENEQFFKNVTFSVEEALNVVNEKIHDMISKVSHTDEEFLDTKVSMEYLITMMDKMHKWMRVAHTAMRLYSESPTRTSDQAKLQSRRDTCFVQALTTLITGLFCWLNTAPGEIVHKLITSGLGPLCGFEGLLSLYATEKTMWGDMVVAIEDLHAVVFKLVKVAPCASKMPQVTGSRNALVVKLPVSDALFAMFEKNKEIPTFTITAVFFNVGINEKASVAEALGETRPQHYSNNDNLDRLTKYYHKYTKVFPNDPMQLMKASSRSKPLEEVMENLRRTVQKRAPKNVEILQLASLATRLMNGVRFTSCKSAKDRTGMAVTLEQCAILSSEYHLADHDQKKALDIMRSDGCRRENTAKNIGMSKYAFSKKQVHSLPNEYRPPQGSYGATLT